jgi:hypothetical protein
VIEEKKSLIDAAEDVEVSSFEIKYTEKGLISLRIEFNLSNESNCWATEVQLEGQLLKW